MLLGLDEDKVSADTTADVTYRIASTRQEREAAFRLVYQSYLRSGLGEVNDYQMRVTPYHLLPTTEVFIAQLRGEVIFTMSLVTDGELGVPMEHVYGDEIARLRRQGLRVGEVSCLADRRAALERFFPVFLRTSRLMVQYARRSNRSPKNWECESESCSRVSWSGWKRCMQRSMCSFFLRLRSLRARRCSRPWPGHCPWRLWREGACRSM